MVEERRTGYHFEEPVNPEIVWGKDFRVPSIKGLGSGLGFELIDFHLPKNWHKYLNELQKINHEYLNRNFQGECESFELPTGEIKFDKDGLLREISIKTDPVSRLYLDLELPKENEGNYKSENIESPLTAIVMQKFATKILSLLLGEKEEIHHGYPYIEGNWGNFSPIDLIIPEKFLKSEEFLYSQEAFTIEASNILGRFGFTLKVAYYNEKNGLLTSFDLKEGQACGFYLDRSSGIYHAHNIDDPSQAVALFGVAAAYINHLLER